MSRDVGYFGPESVSWQVHREVTVLFGGARALLMHAAHPLVVAGANQTAMYERNPWRRLQRTLVLQYAITFGTKQQADLAARRINEVHERVHGIDRVTGRWYDALDPSLLLWVHACLVDSALLFEGLTVGRLDDVGRQRFHEEQLLAAEMLRLPSRTVPRTVGDLERYVDDVSRSDELVVTDAARTIAGLFLDPPREATWRPVLRLVARLAFGTLPSPIRRAYGVPPSHFLGPTFGAIRRLRPLLPPQLRYIAPYRSRGRGQEDDGIVDPGAALRRSLGIRLE